MSRNLGPTELSNRLRSQARAMKAGPDSLLNQAADTIDAQQYLLVERQRMLLRCAEMMAMQTLTQSAKETGS